MTQKYEASFHLEVDCEDVAEAIKMVAKIQKGIMEALGDYKTDSAINIKILNPFLGLIEDNKEG
jgi:hypothetical protein